MTPSPKQKRMSAKLKAELALLVLSGTARRELLEQHGATDAELNSWVETFITGGREAFRNKRDDASREAEVARLHQKVGELYMRLESTSRALPNGNGSGSVAEED